MGFGQCGNNQPQREDREMIPCIHREDMPQIDKEFFPSLLSYLDELGYAMEQTTLPTATLHPVQCLNQIVGVRRKEILTKPLLVASDRYILDGNNRWQQFTLDHVTEVPVYLISAPFNVCFEVLSNFPHTYYYRDPIHRRTFAW